MSRGVQDRDVPWRFRLGLFALGIGTWVVQMAARGNPEWVETLFARGLYPVVREVVGTLTGWTSFSFTEAGLILFASLLVYRLLRARRGVARGARTWRNVGAHFVSGTLALTGLFYAWGMFGWGFNYYRQPFLATENLDRTGITAQELQAVAFDLVDEANPLRRSVEEDDGGVMRTDDLPRRAIGRAGKAFASLDVEYASLRDGFVSRPKGPVAPLLPWFGVSGVFFPYTGEAHVGLEQPPAGQLFAACHELAHQLGWAREEEANFVGYAICRRHPELDYRYAAAQGALRYVLHTLRAVDPDGAAAVTAALDDGIVRDWEASRTFWLAHDTFVGDAAERVNDAYLKAQGQEAGVGSYGLMVDLLVADRRRGR